jgi:hypothetical protein
MESPIISSNESRVRKISNVVISPFQLGGKKKSTTKCREMLGALLVFSLCPPNCDVAFKNIIEFEIIIIIL